MDFQLNGNFEAMNFEEELSREFKDLAKYEDLNQEVKIKAVGVGSVGKNVVNCMVGSVFLTGLDDVTWMTRG